MQGYLRGHGTYVEEGTDGGPPKLLACVAGVVERVNKLISVRPIKSRCLLPSVQSLSCRTTFHSRVSPVRPALLQLQARRLFPISAFGIDLETGCHLMGFLAPFARNHI